MPMAPAVNGVRELTGNCGGVRERLVGHNDPWLKAGWHGGLEGAQEALNLARLAAAGKHEQQWYKLAGPIRNACGSQAMSIRVHLGVTFRQRSRYQ